MYDSTQRQIMTTAELILAEKIGLVDGSRRLVRLFHGLGDKEWDRELFDPIVAFESETEALPVGDLRSMWDPEALAAKEDRAKPYLDEAKGWIFEICRGLIAKYEREVGEKA